MALGNQEKSTLRGRFGLTVLAELSTHGGGLVVAFATNDILSSWCLVNFATNDILSSASLG